MCVIDLDVIDTWDFGKVAVRSARKEYRCGECRQKILPGQRYEVACGKWNGQFDTCRTCLPCQEIRDRFMCGGYEYGNVWEAIYEYFSDGDMVDLDGMSLEAIDKIQARLQPLWDELNEEDEAMAKEADIP